MALLFTLYSWIAGHGQSFFKDGAIAFPPSCSLATSITGRTFDVPASRSPPTGSTNSSHPRRRHRLQRASPLVLHETFPKSHRPCRHWPMPVCRPKSASYATPFSRRQIRQRAGRKWPVDLSQLPERRDRRRLHQLLQQHPKAARAFKSANGVVVSKPGQEALLADAKTPEGVRSSLQTLGDPRPRRRHRFSIVPGRLSGSPRDPATDIRKRFAQRSDEFRGSDPVHR